MKVARNRVPEVYPLGRGRGRGGAEGQGLRVASENWGVVRGQLRGARDQAGRVKVAGNKVPEVYPLGRGRARGGAIAKGSGGQDVVRLGNGKSGKQIAFAMILMANIYLIFVN